MFCIGCTFHLDKRRRKHRKEELHAGGSDTENGCPDIPIFPANCRCAEKAMKLYLEHHKQGRQVPHGKQSVKELVGQGAGASNIEIAEGNIKSFERVARKYYVDFAVKKDKSVQPPKYLVFFKGRDTDVIKQAFQEFVGANEKKQSRVSVKKRLTEFQKQLAKDKNRERAREHQKDRGQSL